MPDEKQYLQKISLLLSEQAEKALQLAEKDDSISDDTLILLEEVIDAEARLREDNHIGARFTVISSQLKQLMQQADAFYSLELATKSTGQDESAQVGPDEVVVYVYLYNAQGRILNSWERFLQPSALREHSVNRPIYSAFQDVKKLFRNKLPSQNHGCLEMKVKQSDIVTDAENTSYFDANNAPLLRLRQGGLKAENILSFYCDERRYHLNAKGRLQVV